jgi:hypothetical protein
MATEIRKRFELDPRLLATDGTKTEPTRLLRLARQYTRLKDRQEHQVDTKGFETNGRPRVATLLKKHELNASQIEGIVKYWFAHRPKMADLGPRFKISALLA